MIDNETFIVQSAFPDRLYVKTYHDFLDSTIIDGKEKLIFILLKRYLNFKDDKCGVEGTVYPTLDTLSKQAGMTKKTVIGILKKLESKGLIVVKQQGLNKPNIYTIRDFSGIWKAGTDEEVKAAIDLYEEEYEDSKIIERLRDKGYTVIKEKEPETLSAEQSNNDPSTKNNQFDIVNTKTKSQKSQALERYTLEQIRQLYDYDIMIHDNPDDKQYIDDIIELLKEKMNTTLPTIRVGREDKPTMVVVGKLMKLTYLEIMYVIENFKKQTKRISNTDNYLLTMLYNAKRQMNNDITNQVQHDMYDFEPPTE